MTHIRKIHPEGLFAQWCRKGGFDVPTEIDLDDLGHKDFALLSWFVDEVVGPITRERTP